jgi:predicted RNA-binding Zn-ribbon protein involved in translation (DUF1610 family)
LSILRRTHVLYQPSVTVPRGTLLFRIVPYGSTLLFLTPLTFMEEDACAKCGLKQSSTSNMTEDAGVFQVNLTCGHKFCDMCLDHELNRKRQFACPKCRAMVTREKLSRKSLDENEVERDFRIRRRICSIFNKAEDQFASLDDFKDYEELREDIIYNLVHEIDVQATEQRVKAYEAENLVLITTNQSKILEEKSREQQAIRAQEEQRKARIAALQDAMNKEKVLRKEHERQMNEFLLGERDEVSAKLPSDKTPITLSAQQHQQQQQQNILSAVIGAPNQVQLYLRQRPEPVPVPGGSVGSKMDVDAQEIHRAGGYNSLAYTQRNWIELVSSLSISVSYSAGDETAPVTKKTELSQELKMFEEDVTALSAEEFLQHALQKKPLPRRKWSTVWR